MSRAEALRGQLADATEQLAEASARAGTLAESLAEALRSAQSAQAEASWQRTRAEGMPCPLCNFVFVSILHLASEESCPPSAGLETALDEAVKNCKALAEAAEQKEAERVAVSEAISAFCQAFGLDGVPSGSSPPESSAGLRRPCARQTPRGAAPRR
jgi:DNA repair exonuclease SbcCD ATPase subunit